MSIYRDTAVLIMEMHLRCVGALWCIGLCSQLIVGGHPNRRIGETHVLNENGLCRPKNHTCSSLAISRIFLNNTIR